VAKTGEWAGAVETSAIHLVFQCREGLPARRLGLMVPRMCLDCRSASSSLP